MISDHSNKLQLLADRIENIEKEYKTEILLVKEQVYNLNSKRNDYLAIILLFSLNLFIL